MAASYDTVRAVLRVVQRHVDAATLKKIIAELEEIPGNKSFRNTIMRLDLCSRENDYKPRKG